ncbi:MAG TPA: hypothetical protein VJG30_00385 [Candidatus Nanoarchaeia archaeon]|nr:hypothetical protein [Candidatus Nanoarchaeia archaeon]
MIIIDSSTLILLSKIGVLDTVINNSKMKIVLTEWIVKELTAKKTNDAVLIEERIKNEKLKVEKIKSTLTNGLIKDFNIGKGEAEILAFVLENKLPVITDDKKAINICRIFNLEFTTAISIVVSLYNKKIINQELFSVYLKKLEKYGRYNDEIINKAREDTK